MKRLTFLMALLFVALLPLAARAQERTDLRVGGNTYEAETLKKNLSGEGWRWNASSNILTLNGLGDRGQCRPLVLPDRCRNLVLAGQNFVRDVEGGKVTVKGGGNLDGEYMYFSSLTIGGGSIRSEGVSASDRLVIKGGSVALSSYGDLAGERVVISGGKIGPQEGHLGINIRGWQSLRVTGGILTDCSLESREGNIRVTGGRFSFVPREDMGCAMTAMQGTVSIGGKAEVSVEGDRRAVLALSFTIGGKPADMGIGVMRVVKGKLKSAQRVEPDFMVEGKEYSERELRQDLSGQGWRWSAKSHTLTLNGCDFVRVYNNGVTVKLEGEQAVQLQVEDGCRPTLTGKGTIGSFTGYEVSGLLIKDADIAIKGTAFFNNRGLEVVNSTLTATGLSSLGEIRMINSQVEAVEIYTKSALSVDRTRILCFQIRSDAAAIRRSLLCVSEVLINRQPGLTDSMLIYGTLENSAGATVKPKLKNTALFRRYERNAVLEQNAVLRVPITLPQGYTLTVPAGRTLTLKAKLTVPAGSRVVCEGRIKGQNLIVSAT